ncbi:MAG TPA: hypothetical protein VHQ86_05620, partial [Candidatus Saccharimonadia bacterium]|nr:hypothetical protein [Candidatus Saccharimonadia bacterium]
TGSNVTTGAPGTIKCIKETYTDTSGGSTVPTGMTTTGGGVTFDTAGSNYMPTPGAWTFTHTVNGTITLTDAAGEIPASAAARKISINGITNSSVADTKFFLHFQTFNNTDCATSPVDSVTVLFILTNGSTLSLTVDQTLSFSVNAVGAGQNCNGATSTAASTATTIPFGTVTTAANSVVCQDLSAATNATNGYTIYARYTAKPTNALAQTIADWTGTNAAPTAFPAAGTEAYGYTTNDFTLGTGTAGRFNSNLWAAMTTGNTEVAYEAAGVTTTTYRIGHQVGVSLTTRPGTYTTTVIYTCTPIY